MELGTGTAGLSELLLVSPWEGGRPRAWAV